ncbi:hypothetical protein Pcinc_020622 [Petrolisthes cinctipes]|uniref:Uncharacterized protein n=1 Tax=Petrolisthes cinctipes TaxID=88211 RepID=A0AAE1FM44_PETCI|nr:hypothetical protein Pcinc_020622 [Petrolisthes cinctipes]
MIRDMEGVCLSPISLICDPVSRHSHLVPPILRSTTPSSLQSFVPPLSSLESLVPPHPRHSNPSFYHTLVTPILRSTTLVTPILRSTTLITPILRSTTLVTPILRFTTLVTPILRSTTPSSLHALQSSKSAPQLLHLHVLLAQQKQQKVEQSGIQNRNDRHNSLTLTLRFSWPFCCFVKPRQQQQKKR